MKTNRGSFLRSLILCHIYDNIDAFVNADQTGIEAEVVILAIAPVAVGVVFIVDSAFAVFVGQALLGCLLGMAVFFYDAGGAVFQIRVDEHVQAILPLAEDIVGTAAYDDTRPLLCQLADHIGLADKQLVSHGHGIHHG